jgi:hypothetical protein
VLYHGKDRDEVYRKALTPHPKRSAIVYTGEMEGETALVSSGCLTRWSRGSLNVLDFLAK